MQVLTELECNRCLGATGSSCLAFSTFCGVMTFFRSHSYPDNVAREPRGMPLAYFPLRSPEASGLHIVVPKPISRYKGRYSSSTRSRWSILYGVVPFEEESDHILEQAR